MKQNFAAYPIKEPMLEVLGAISKIGVTDIEDILSPQPDNWLDKNNKDAIVAWWKSGGAVDRSTSLINGVADDSVL